MAGRAIYNSLNFGVDAVDTGTPAVPYVIGAGAAAVAGQAVLAAVACAAMLGGGYLLASGGYALADTVMRDRDRPPDALSQGMEDAAHRDGRAPRPSLSDLETVNARSNPGYVPAQRASSPTREGEKESGKGFFGLSWFPTPSAPTPFLEDAEPQQPEQMPPPAVPVARRGRMSATETPRRQRIRSKTPASQVFPYPANR